MSTTVIITIGLNSNRTLAPLNRRRRDDFCATLDAALRGIGDVHVGRAPHPGDWVDAATGQLVKERSRTWVVGLYDLIALDYLRAFVAGLASQFEQDAIALTVGTTELVPAA